MGQGNKRGEQMAELKNRKHERFCWEYIQDYNQTQAAIRTGYKESNARDQGSALLTNPDILARVRELQQEQMKRLGLSADMVILETLKTYRNCLNPTPVLQFNPVTRKWEESGEYQFDSKGALKALEMLGRHMGLFDKKTAPAGAADSNLLAQLLGTTGEDINTDDLPEVK